MKAPLIITQMGRQRPLVLTKICDFADPICRLYFLGEKEGTNDCSLLKSKGFWSILVQVNQSEDEENRKGLASEGGIKGQISGPVMVHFTCPESGPYLKHVLLIS